MLLVQSNGRDYVMEQDRNAVLDKIYVCTSTREQNDFSMKPNPGMILQACHDFDVSPEDCVFVGDTITDLQAATSAKVPFKILVSTGYGGSIMERDAPATPEMTEPVDERSSIPGSIVPFYFTRNLASAVSFVLETKTSSSIF